MRFWNDKTIATEIRAVVAKVGNIERRLTTKKHEGTLWVIEKSIILTSVVALSFIILSNFICLKVKVAQLCTTLCDPMDYGLPGSSVHGIFQARILEWVAVPFSRGASQPRDRTQVSCIAGGFFTV